MSQHLSLRCLGLLVLLCMGSVSQVYASWKALPMSKQEAQKQLQPRKFAIVIGINQTRKPYWSPLLYARKDAIKMTKALIQVAGFSQVRLHTRRKDTTRKAILQSLQHLKKQVKSPLDTVFIYFSAHGTVTDNPSQRLTQRYIVTSDTTQKIAKTALSVQKILTLLKKLPSKRIVLMLATCYTGAPKSKSRSLPGHKGRSMKGMKPLKTRALQILSASGFAQAAYESTKLKSDVYTHFFLDCLRKLRRKKNAVSAIDIHICAAKPTTAFVKKHKSEIQVPRVDSQPGANKDVYLFQKRGKQPSMGYFWASRKRRNVRYQLYPKGARYPTQSSFWATPGEWIGVRTGHYVVTIRDDYGRVVRRYTINIRRQQWYTPSGPDDDDPFYHRRSVSPVDFDEPPLHPLIKVGYALGGMLLISSGSFTLYGVWQRKAEYVIPGIIVFGAGGIVTLGAMISDWSTRSSHREMIRLRQGGMPTWNQQKSLPSTSIPLGTTSHQMGSY